MSAVTIGKAFAAALDVLRSHGFDVDDELDMARASNRLKGIGKPSLTPVLCGNTFVFTRRSGISLFMTKGGQDVAGGMARIDDLGCESFGDFMPRLMARMYDFSGDQMVASRGGHLSKNISGKVVYLGDLFIKPEIRGSLAILEAFVTLLEITSYIEWPDCDWMCAYLRERDVMRGTPNRYNFSELEAIPNLWTNPPAGRSNEEYLVATTREGFVDRLRARVLQSTSVE